MALKKVADVLRTCREAREAVCELREELFSVGSNVVFDGRLCKVVEHTPRWPTVIRIKDGDFIRMASLDDVELTGIAIDA